MSNLQMNVGNGASVKVVLVHIRLSLLLQHTSRISIVSQNHLALNCSEQILGELERATGRVVCAVDVEC